MNRDRRYHLPRRKLRLGLEGLELRTLLAGDLIINEIMYHPAGDNSSLEYIELHNTTASPISLTGWRFDSGIDFTFPAGEILAGDYLIVAADVAVFQASYPTVTNVIGGWTGRLANRGERLALLDVNQQVVDLVSYADEGDWGDRFLDELDQRGQGWSWDAAHDGDGRSLELINAELPNEYGQNWTASVVEGGTPGSKNSVVRENIAPIVSQVSHSPAIPSSTDVVAVSALIIDETVADAALYYRRDGVDAFTTTALLDDGLGSDRLAGDRIFTATIPAQSDGTIVEFYVRAEDQAGNERVVPAFQSTIESRSAHLLYQVIDGAPDPQNWNPESQPQTYLVMTDFEQRMLAEIGSGTFQEASSRSQVNATFIRVDGNGVDLHYNVGVRNRGGASRQGPPNNYRVNFTHDKPWNGFVSTNLNSRVVHAQTIGSAIFRLAGMPAAAASPVQVRVNDVDLSDAQQFGSYAQLEVITGSFPDTYFPTDRRGNLYRVIESGTESGDLRFEGFDPDAYRATYSKRTNEELDDWSDLIELVDVLNNTPDSEFLTAVERVVDVDQWLRYFAMDSLLGNMEYGLNVGAGDNFWLYRGTEDTRFRLIPHDLDTILSQGGTVGQPNRSIFVYTDTPGLRKFFTHSEIVPRYYQAFLDLIDEIYNPETLHPIIDQVLGGFVPAETIGQMKQFVVDRIAGIQAQLPTEFAITTSLPVVDGIHRSTIPSTELVGTANAIETKSVVVNGQRVEWSPFQREWSVSTTSQGQTESLIDFGSAWNYLDDGSSQTNSWRTRAFDDSRWRTGASPLGYGNGDEATRIGFGSNPNNKSITSYFRHDFNVSDASQVLDLTLRLQRDDGAIVYLNGQEIVRSNMPAGNVDFQTVATSWIGGSLEDVVASFSVDPSLLVDGENLLAVEVHQRSAIDDDLRLEVALEATTGTVEGGIALNPGINRLVVQAFDQLDGQGNVVDQGFVDIWYDGASGIDTQSCSQFNNLAPSIVSAGTLTQDSTLAPCGPAYRVTGNVVVPTGVTMTVMPGTTLFFDEGAGLTIEGGRLVAEGTDAHQIRFTRTPSSSGNWEGIHFVNSMQDNRITHAVVEHAATDNGMVGVESSQLLIENSTFDHTDRFRIFTTSSSLTVRNSTFVDIFGPNEPPTTDNSSEHIKGSGIAANGVLLIENNYFGTTKGHNDAIDFDGAQLPGPIPIIRDNYFAGSGDDAVDLETDAYIVGNTFVNVIKDEFNTSTGDANAISAGNGREYFVARNVFSNVDHAVQVKDDAFLTFQNNTVANVRISPIYFDLPDRTPGRGALVEDSIFVNTPLIFGALEQADEVSIHRSVVTADALSLGTGNVLHNARLLESTKGNFQLGPGSSARGLGFNGIDAGANVVAGATISGEPRARTNASSARLVVGGALLTAYRYRINDGPWSDATPIDQPIELNGLSSGSYRVEVVGRNIVGEWQSLEAATLSNAWNVGALVNPLRINEVLASNASISVGGRTSDLIELHNAGADVLDLSGMTLSDDIRAPAKYTFPSGTALAADGYLTIAASTRPVSGVLTTGFNLDADGTGVFLFSASGGSIIDSVEFGLQATDLSIGRVGHDQQWKLNRPSFGQANTEQPTGDPNTLKINEWLAQGDFRSTDDLIEIYNPDQLPVELSGLYLTDDRIGEPTKAPIGDLSFIAGSGFTLFQADREVDRGPDHLPFRLTGDGEIVTLLSVDQQVIDSVIFYSQTADVSQGRSPDGTDQLQYARLITPALPNPVYFTENESLTGFDGTWSFDQSGDDLGTSWRAPDFDDISWSEGPGVLGVATSEIPVQIGTPLELGVKTYYFRHAFEISQEQLDQPDILFNLSTLVDDGVVVYLNGEEVLRLGVRLVNGKNQSSRVVNPTIEGPFAIPSEMLKSGTNVIAAEVHNISTTSNDVVFGLELESSRTFTDANSIRQLALLDGLRISELMYHPRGDKDEEYLEFVNVSDTVLDLTGVRLVSGIDFTFGSTLLAPNQRIVISPNAATFRATYGSGPRLVGEYTGSLSNGGELIDLRLPDPYELSILRFSYSDSWEPTTDGDGYSLQIVDPAGYFGNWNVAAGWRASRELGGSPGASDNGASLLGDFNGDGNIDAADIDLLCSRIQDPTIDNAFDLNNDGKLTNADLNILVEDIIGTKPGDANLDGKVNFADFLLLGSNFGNSRSWSGGDFNCDGLVNFVDFLVLGNNFGFTNAAVASALDKTD